MSEKLLPSGDSDDGAALVRVRRMYKSGVCTSQACVLVAVTMSFTVSRPCTADELHERCSLIDARPPRSARGIDPPVRRGDVEYSGTCKQEQAGEITWAALRDFPLIPYK